MSRPTTKQALLAAIAEESAALESAVHAVPRDRRDQPGACDHWSVKDILAHLDAWHRMFLGWHEAGLDGVKPAMPAEGYTWSQTPELNEAIHRRTQATDWDEVTSNLADSTKAVITAIESYDADELFEKRRHPWTGTTSVGSYAVSATSSHYAWARKLITAFSRSL